MNFFKKLLLIISEVSIIIIVYFFLLFGGMLIFGKLVQTPVSWRFFIGVIFSCLYLLYCSGIAYLLDKWLTSDIYDYSFFQHYPKLSILAIMQKRKITVVLLQNSLMFLVLLAYIIMCKRLEINFDIYTLILIIGIIIIMNIRELLFEYRVRKNTFGKNEYEAREIITFIISNRLYINFDDENRPKNVFPDCGLQSLHSVIVDLLKLIPEKIKK